jgi:hypothetical protein
MTERWRKKLDDLDEVGPTDDVYRRAKASPVDPHEPLPGPKTSNRVVTGVVAFSVFALALSAFALPLLRMGSTAPADEGSLGMFPIWPAQTSADLQRLQDSPAPWALDPKATAIAFTERVMGWSGASAKLNDEPGCVFGAGASPTPIPGNQGGCTSPSVAVDGLLTYSVWPPPGPCNDVGTEQMGGNAFCAARPPEFVEVYQPLAQGDGQIWAVHQAAGSFPRTTMSVVAEQHVRDGASINATVSPLEVGSFAALGYGSCNQYASVVSGGNQTSDGGSSSGLAIEVQLTDVCQGYVQGYAWAATSSQPLYPHTDPILHRAPDTPVLSTLTAVPVVMVFPSGGGETTVSSTPAPTAQAVGWTTYTDPKGWSIDVPTDWDVQIITQGGNDGAAFSTGDLSLQIGIVPIQTTGDDSRFPLDADQLLGPAEAGLIGHFRGDGQEFMVDVPSIYDLHDIPDNELETVRHMIGSISFEPWRVGETRNGWTAVGKALRSASAQWVGAGQHFLTSGSDGHRLAFGPPADCVNGTPTFEIRESGSAAESCPDGTGGDWNVDTGEPLPGNSPGFTETLPSFPAVYSWDDQLLITFPPMGAAATPTTTPS